MNHGFEVEEKTNGKLFGVSELESKLFESLAGMWLKIGFNNS
jgi:hypothetical protein